MIYRKIKKGSQTVHDALLQYLTDNLNSSSPNLYIENSPTLCCTRHAYHEKEINREPAMQPNHFMFFFLAQNNGTVSLRSVSSFNELI